MLTPTPTGTLVSDKPGYGPFYGIDRAAWVKAFEPYRMADTPDMKHIGRPWLSTLPRLQRARVIWRLYSRRN